MSSTLFFIAAYMLSLLQHCCTIADCISLCVNQMHVVVSLGNALHPPILRLQLAMQLLLLRLSRSQQQLLAIDK